MSSPTNSKNPNEVKDSPKNAKNTKEKAFRNNAGSQLHKPPPVKSIPEDPSRRFHAPQTPTSKNYFLKKVLIEINFRS